MFRRKKPVDKKKLEHKLYLARETPEPVFDLSECNLQEVPTGIYSLCKVFLKESLILHDNQLSSLSGGGALSDLYNLRVLDVSRNSFSTLPEEIHSLKNLEELYAKNNQLKKLPNGLCHLVNLKILDLSFNLLKSLPEELGNLTNLKQLKLLGNKHLIKLPKSLGKAQRLARLELDASEFLYPPREVAELGTEAIVKYICEDTGFEHKPENVHLQFDTTDSYEGPAAKLGALKRNRTEEFLEIERHNELLQKQEFELATANKANREKLLMCIAAQQIEIDDRLSKIQQEREAERFRLVEQLQQTENNADIAINKLLTLNKEPSSQLLDREKEEEEKLLAAVAKYNETLRKEDVLSAMEAMLRQEAEMFDKFDRNRAEASRSILERELESDSKLLKILEQSGEHKSELVSELLRADDLQKAAVGTLLERSDARSWGLLQQVRLVESQLVALTNIELDRKKLRMDEHLNDLAEKRINLSILLVDLLDQQRQRRAQLLQTLRCIEERNTNGSEDFWLRQYQQLLDELPDGLARAHKNIDTRLSQCLLVNGVLHYLPFLAKFDPHSVTELDLTEVGVDDELDRIKILDALRTFVSNDCTPSAPVMEGPSAPPADTVKAISTAECVVCMELECHVIFIPCGHLCCCSDCSGPLTSCPLCRTAIDRRILLAQ